jgi:hypothetical protein
MRIHGGTQLGRRRLDKAGHKQRQSGTTVALASVDGGSKARGQGGLGATRVDEGCRGFTHKGRGGAVPVVAAVALLPDVAMGRAREKSEVESERE